MFDPDGVGCKCLAELARDLPKVKLKSMLPLATDGEPLNLGHRAVRSRRQFELQAAIHELLAIWIIQDHALLKSLPIVAFDAEPKGKRGPSNGGGGVGLNFAVRRYARRDYVQHINKGDAIVGRVNDYPGRRQK